MKPIPISILSMEGSNSLPILAKDGYVPKASSFYRSLVFDFDGPISNLYNKFGSLDPVDLEVGGSKGDSGGGFLHSSTMNGNLLELFQEH